MTDYVVNVSFRVDSRPLKNLNKEVEETTESLKKATSASERTRQRLVDGFDKVSDAADAARGGIGGIGAELVSMARVGSVAINPVTVGLLALAAGAAAAVGILVSVTSQLNEIHKLNDISDITGANVQELAKLEAIAKLGGESLDGLKLSLQKNQVALKSAREDSAELADLYGRLGLSVRELQKMDPALAWRVTAAAIAETTDKGLKADAAMKLMGKSASDLTKEFGSQAQQEEKLNEARRLGIERTPEQIKQAAELDKAQDSLNASVASFKTILLQSFGNDVVTAIGNLAKLVNWLAESMQVAQKWADGLGTSLGKIVLTPGMAAVEVWAKRVLDAYAKINGFQSRAQNPRGGAPMAGSLDTNAGRGPNTREQTEKEIADAAAKAAAAQKKAADEAERQAKAWRDTLASADKLVNAYGDQAAIDSARFAFLSGENDLREANVRLMDAQVKAAQSLGATVEGAVQAETGLGVQLQYNLEALQKEKNLSAAQVAELDKRVKLAVANAEANERARIADEAILRGRSELQQMHQSTLELERAREVITSGQVKTEEQLTRYLADQAYWSGIEKQIKEGTLTISKEELKAMKERRDAAQIALNQEQESLKQMETLYQNIGDGLANSITDALKTGRLDFKSFISDIITMLINSHLKKVFASMFEIGGSGGGDGFWSNLLQVGSALFGVTAPASAASGAAASGIAYAKGGAFNNGVEFFANGGVVNRTTGFGLSGGKLGVMGEAGPEAILPLARGRNGKLGVAASGSGGTVNQVNIAPGAVVVNSSGDNAADTAAFAKSLDKVLNEKVAAYIRDQQRSGNTLNPNFGYRY